MRTCRKIVCIGVAAVLLLFGAHPIALLPLGVSGEFYYVHVPAAFILKLLSLPVIAASRFRGRSVGRIRIGVFSAVRRLPFRGRFTPDRSWPGNTIRRQTAGLAGPESKGCSRSGFHP